MLVHWVKVIWAKDGDFWTTQGWEINFFRQNTGMFERLCTQTYVTAEFRGFFKTTVIYLGGWAKVKTWLSFYNDQMFEILCKAVTQSRISIGKNLDGDDLHENEATNRPICRPLLWRRWNQNTTIFSLSLHLSSI